MMGRQMAKTRENGNSMNVQHRTPNIERRTSNKTQDKENLWASPDSTFDVGRSMFDVCLLSTFVFS